MGKLSVETNVADQGTRLLAILEAYWDERVHEISSDLDYPLQDGIPLSMLSLSAAAAGRRAGMRPASARYYLWQLVRSGLAKTCDSPGDGYPTTQFYAVSKNEGA